MSESFRERVRRMERLLNKMDDYERNHPDEWCPISDEMLKQIYPDECQSQEGRDRKAETMQQEEFEMVFDAVLQRYRMRRKRKQGELSELSAEREEEAEKVIVEQI
ncbi:MAG TPA: hypothetical protein VKA09_16255 [Nitrososphaeraceae archaeon]|nr:hypothetical protein [Nitrososphaeraceae archaeon]